MCFDDIAATMQAMLSGQVDAAGMSAFAAKSVADRNPKASIENKFTVTHRVLRARPCVPATSTCCGS